jgi:hypothetical protein
MNRDSAIARDPYKKCAYFMGRIRGQKTQGWVQRNYDWLDRVENNEDELLGRSPWAVLEEDFRRAFMDYAQQEKAHDQLQKLKMISGNIDEYISEFQMLGHQAGMDLDEVTALRLFARGLPKKLADACIDLDGPESFEQWRNSAQRQHRAFLKKQAIHRDYRKPAFPKPQVPLPTSWNGLRRWNNNQGGANPPRPRLPPCNPNAMDISAGKVSTEDQKKKFRIEGHCFECEKQGHIVRNCPTKKTQVRSTEITDDQLENQEQDAEQQSPFSVQDLIARATKFTDEEKHIFIQGMCEDEVDDRDPGFLEA